MLRFLVVLSVILVVYALLDCARSEERERVGIPKYLWILFIVLFPVLGPITWLVVSRANRHDHPPAPARPTRPRPRRDGPLAPDDDPEFLWRLEQQARRERARREGHAHRDEGDDPPHDAHTREQRERSRDDED